MTTLVVGGDSLVGAALTRQLQRARQPVVATTRRSESATRPRIYLDLAASPSDWRLPDSIDTAVLCAAASKSDACERDPVGTQRINVEGTVALAEAVVDRGGRVLFLSSNQVFDGITPFPAPDHPVCPVTEYGRQKAETETKLLARHASAVSVLRMTKVLGAHNPLFTGWMQELRRGGVIRPFRDMYISPVPVTAVLSIVALILERSLAGIFHLSAERDVSYEEAAQCAMRNAGGEPRQLEACDAHDVLRDRPFPRRSALGLDGLIETFGVQPPAADWTLTRAFTQPAILEPAT